MNSKKYNEVISLVKSQTNYSEDVIKEKLAKHNNNYLNVIKEYMGITEENSSFNKYNAKTPESVNQGIFQNIREFMDTNIRQYEERKRIDEYNKKIIEKQMEIQKQMEVQKQSINEEDNIKITENKD